LSKVDARALLCKDICFDLPLSHHNEVWLESRTAHKEVDLRRVYARNLISLGRLDPFIVDKQTSRLRILNTIRRSKLNRQTRHIANRNSKESQRSRVSQRKRSRGTEEGAVHLEKTKEGKCPRRYIP
jgi:hypothetical protein